MTKKIGRFFLCCLMTITVFQNVVANTRADSTDELRNKALPTVQSYTVDSTNTWQVLPISRMLVLSSNQTLNNKHLEDVVKLMNSEFADKKIPSDKTMPIIYSVESEIIPGDIVITLGNVEEITNDEAYKIEISDHVKITAVNEKAALYALRTIMNIMITNNKMNYGTIIDYPDVAERSFHIDMARKFYSKDWIISQIKEMSLMKLNTLQIHFSENEGFRLESETHPEVMSSEYITKSEMEEIIDTAHLYGVDIIPSFDTPGHLQQALKTHTDLQLPTRTGSKLNSALDITNPKARVFIKEIYDEYALLFKDSKYFHIGADEFINFAQFTNYPVLESYAKEKYGVNATGLDAYIDYVNDIASHMESKGFITRAWNDGVYRANIKQTIELKKSIQITYWTKWDKDMATVQKFLDEGHDIINFNDAYFYYVLGENAGYKYPTGDKIFNNWHPGVFPTISSTQIQTWERPYPEQLKGASFAIWSDKPAAQTMQQVADGIYEPLRAMAQKSWNAASSTQTYAKFKENFNEIGHVAGYDHELPKPSEIIKADKLGSVQIRYVDTEDKELASSETKYGIIDNNYEIKALDIYGYKLKGDMSVIKGAFKKDQTIINFVYEKYTDKTKLNNELENALKAKDSIYATYTEYKGYLALAKEMMLKQDVSQLEVDELLGKLKDAKMKVISIERLDLYNELQLIAEEAVYTLASYSEYKAAVTEAKEVLFDKIVSKEDVEKSLQKLVNTKAKLVYNTAITVTTNKGIWQPMTYGLANLFDGNPETFTWIEGNQAIGDYFLFAFPNAVNLEKIRIQAPSTAGADIINGADIEVSNDGITWVKKGSIEKDFDKTINVNESNIRYARIRYTKSTSTWTKLGEVTFSYTTLVNKVPLQEAVTKSKTYDKTLYTQQTYAMLEKVLTLAEQLLSSDSVIQYQYDTYVNYIEDAIAKLKGKVNLDVTELLKAIEIAEGIKPSDYTENSVVALNKALVNAQDVLDDENAEQVDVDSVCLELGDAIKNLVNKNTLIEEREYRSEDGSVIIFGLLPGNLELIGNKYTDITGIKDRINKDFFKNYELEDIYEISLLQNDEIYTPENSLLVKIKTTNALEGKMIGIVYIAPDGTLEHIVSNVKNGYLEFETAHLSDYAIISVKEIITIDKPSSETKDSMGIRTGDETNLFELVLLGGIALLVLAYYRSKIRS